MGPGWKTELVKKEASSSARYSERDEDYPGKYIARSMGIKKRDMIRRDTVKKWPFRKEMRTLNRNVSHSNEITMKSSLLENRVVLLGVLPNSSPQYSHLLNTVLDDVLPYTNGQLGDKDDENCSMDNDGE